VQWAKNSDGTTPVAAAVVATPASPQVANTYVIYSSITHTYVPTVGYVMNSAGMILSDFAIPARDSPSAFSTTRSRPARRHDEPGTPGAWLTRF